MTLLDQINSPQDLKKLSLEQLPQLAEEVRKRIIEVVYKNGGHLGSNLGVVELTIALHYIFDLGKDRLIWDVSHQSYTHKLLTGRAKDFHTLRQFGGISGFSQRNESGYDPFTLGHAGTSVSLGLGLAYASTLLREDRKVIAVLGDGALGCGVAFEALNHAGALKKDLLVILNDNRMSISYTIGAMANYLNKLRMAPLYNELKTEIYKMLERIPVVGQPMERALNHLRAAAVAPLGGFIFEELGFAYYGPIDGHHLPTLIGTLKEIKRFTKPILLHIITEKGKGSPHALEDPYRFHGIGPLKITEEGKLSRVSDKPTYTDVFSKAIIKLAQHNKSVVAITAAMPEGTGLTEFEKVFPERYFDVGICEQHAVGLAAGLSARGLRPIVAIYSTFLQRAFDQLFQEIALQNSPAVAEPGSIFTPLEAPNAFGVIEPSSRKGALPCSPLTGQVIFALDRAGLVGADGPTHHGVFDITYTRLLPGFILMAPKDGLELEKMLEFAFTLSKPVVIRYPRTGLPDSARVGTSQSIQLGQAEIIKPGRDGVLFAYGSMVYPALEAAQILAQEGKEIMVVNARFAWPLDEKLLVRLVEEQPFLVTLEEHTLKGGFGSAVLETLVRLGKPIQRVITIGLPDEFIPHGSRDKLLEIVGLTPEAIARKVTSSK